jgi:hypothetical protein
MAICACVSKCYNRIVSIFCKQIHDHLIDQSIQQLQEQQSESNYRILYQQRTHRQHWLRTLYTGTTRNHHTQKLKPLTRKPTRNPHQYSRVYVFYLHCRCIRTSSKLKLATDLVLVRLLHSMWHQWRIHLRTLWRRSLSSPTRSLQHCLLAPFAQLLYTSTTITPARFLALPHSLSQSVSHSLAHARTPSLQQVTEIRATDMWHYLTLPHIAVHWVSE